MNFYAVLDQIVELLRSRGRISYRALKRQFNLDDEFLEDLKAEIIDAQQLAIDEEGKVLVWIGEGQATSASTSTAPERAQVSTTQKPQSPQTESPPLASRIPDAERRQLTVLFCDLVDSTKLAGQLDPEDLREVIRAYQHTCAEVIQRFDGHIAQYLGDGLLVYFGYPQAHEDDAQRAVHTGLGILEALGPLNTRLAQEQHIWLAVRVGIHTGLVVVGEIGGKGRQEQLALGETPNIAARLQGLARPDTVVISGVTSRLVQGFFMTEDLGIHPLKGLTTPMPVYRVLSVSAAQSRLEVTPPRGLTPLVGRESEVALLLERWEQVKEGLGQVVFLNGAAGIGKSRLVLVLKDQVANEPHFRWECRCSPYHQHSALYPIIDLFERILHFQRGESPEAKLRKLEESLAPYSMSLPDVIPLFATLLSVSLGDRYAPLHLTPQRQKQKLLEAVLNLLLKLAEQQPLLFIMEDLHWVDPSTLEFLHLLVDQEPTTRIFTLLTFRPDFQAPWSVCAHRTAITLNRLPRRQVEMMIEQVAGGKVLPSEVVQQVVTKTDGVPLFVEELTKMVLESGLLQEVENRYALTGALPPLAIPATLHDSLMARLDRLGRVKEVAQLGATIGRAFPYALLRAVSPLEELMLQRVLERLVEAELLYQRGLPPQAIYLFKHALIQETAYQSLLKSTRQQYHQQIAQVLEAHFPETTETQPEHIAHHYTEAGFNAQAIPYWQQAGQRAIERSAYVEAIAHLTKALELLTTLPDTLDRVQRELVLQTTLGPALIALKGYASPEVEQAYTRARALCQQVGETPQLFPVLWGLWRFYYSRGETRTGQEFGESLLRLAQRVQDSSLLLEAHYALGMTLFWLGEFTAAREHTEQGITLYDSFQHRSLASRYATDPGVNCLSYTALSLWVLGYPEQALKRNQEALALAQKISHPHSHAYALQLANMIYHFRREGQAVQESAAATMALSREQGFQYWFAGGTVLYGWALVMQGQGEEGLVQLRQGLSAWRATGAEVATVYVLVVLAEAYGKIGQIEEGLRVLAEALTVMNNTGERLWEAEVYRLKGELLLQSRVPCPVSGVPASYPALRTPDVEAEAETCFHHALSVARHQQAKSLELRAAMSLSRLWQQQGKHQAARELLAPIYGWFTEGFDTRDLKEAKALLKELA